MTDKELPAVLTIPTQEGQIKRLFELGYTEFFIERKCGRDGSTYEVREGSLADLAFRLREETKWGFYIQALFKVWGKWCEKSWPERKNAGERKKHLKYTQFWMHRAKSIDYVVVGLMAKEHAKDD